MMTETVNDDDGCIHDDTGSVKDGACNDGLMLMMPVVVINSGTDDGSGTEDGAGNYGNND